MINIAPQAIARKTYSLKKDLICFYSLFMAAIYFVYKKPSLALPFFLCLLILAWFSKKHYFWMAFFFTILDGPAWFFVYLGSVQLPLITIATNVSLSPIDCFTVLMAIKLFLQHKKTSGALNKPLMFLMLYFVFCFFWGIVFYSESLRKPTMFIRPVVYYLWYLFFINFINSKEEMFKFLKLLFPITFFITFTQFYFLLTGQEFINLFNPYARGLAINTVTGELRPVTGGTHLMLFSFIGALLLVEEKLKKINGLYYYLIMITSLFSIFISATRTMAVIYFSIFMGVFFKKRKALLPIILIITIAILSAFILLKLEIISSEYLERSAWGRISQVFMVFQGKGGEIDTFESRLFRAKGLSEKISDNLFFGYGFSDVSQDSYDSDWGLFNIFVMFGFFGFLLFVFLFASYFRMLSSALRKLDKASILRRQLRILFISFCVMVLADIFTWDFFSPFHVNRVAFLSIFFGISEILVKHSKEREYKSNNLIKAL